MSSTLLYQPSSRKGIWIALGLALAIQFLAVAYAGLGIKTVPTTINSDVSEVIALDVAPAEAPPAQVEDQPPPIHEEKSEFVDVPDKPRTLVARRPTRPMPRNPSSGGAYIQSYGKALTDRSPRPQYPYEARRNRITGDGVALMSVDAATGDVREVAMTKSTGNFLLDNATVGALRHWHFKSGTATKVRCPITFTLAGAVY